MQRRPAHDWSVEIDFMLIDLVQAVIVLRIVSLGCYRMGIGCIATKLNMFIQKCISQVYEASVYLA